MKFLILTNVASLGAIVIADYFKVQDYCSYTCSRTLDDIFLSLFQFLLIVFVLLLIIFFLPKRVYESWWKFAKLVIPGIFLLLVVFSLIISQPSGGLIFFDINHYVTLSLYSLFILGSIIQIARGYYRK